MTSYTAEWVLPMTGEPIHRGSISITDGRIAGVDDRAPAGAIDLGSVAIMPALVNAHTHLELSYLSGMVPPTETFIDWVRTIMATRRQYPDAGDPRILDAARTAETELAAGRSLGPLHGVPFALKDLFDTAGVRTTGGSKILADRVPAEDAVVTRRLRAAGAILLGKLTMHEFAYGPEGLNVHYGTSRNPWDATEERIPGGSSSGSGVAVAAGLAPLALGSDTGGSIRIPASLCGITGLKPTYGRVSRAGVLPLSWSMDHAGPMTRSALDAALVLRVLAGYDPADATTSVLPVPDYAAALTGNIKGLRVGVLRASFLDASAPEIRQAVESAAKALESLGAVVDEVTLEHMGSVAAGAMAIVASEALAYHAEWVRTRPGDYQPDVVERLRAGAFVSGVHYVRSQQARALVRAEVDRALRGVTHPALVAAGDRARAAVRHAEKWLEGATDHENLEAGARRLALTLGLALETALLVEHASWALEHEGDARPAHAARRLSRLRVDRIDDGSPHGEARALGRDEPAPFA